MEEKETIRPIEITWEELQSRDLDRYILVDTRGDEAVNYGMIPGAIAIPECELVFQHYSEITPDWLRQQGIKR